MITLWIKSPKPVKVLETEKETVPDWKKKTYAQPYFITKSYKKKILKDIKNYSIDSKDETCLSSSPKLLINTSKERNSDEFTLASVTTNTRMNSPTYTWHTEEEEIIDLNLDGDFFLDMYKTFGIFSFPQTCSTINSVNQDSQS